MKALIALTAIAAGGFYLHRAGKLPAFGGSVNTADAAAGAAWFGGGSVESNAVDMSGWFSTADVPEPAQSEVIEREIEPDETTVNDGYEIEQTRMDADNSMPFFGVGDSTIKPLGLMPLNTGVKTDMSVSDRILDLLGGTRLGEIVAAPVKVVESAVKTVSSIGAQDGLLSLIREAEGTSDSKAISRGYSSGYDVTLGYGRYADDKTKRLSTMTLDEVAELQIRILAGHKVSSAVGAYQIVGKTLRGLKKNLGLPGSTIFSASLQDRLAVELLNGRGYQKFLRGELSAVQFQTNLSKEWASIEKPGTGSSYYKNNGVGANDKQMQAALSRFNTGVA